ncbi:MAG TPA: hypothetical protein VKB34_02015, partial [Povalibacter sp.]|nr:hypothetical protein [Povalibacter sp.]
FWLALLFGLALIGLEVFIYGFFGDIFSKPEVDPVRYYDKGYLIFLACFWALLIAGCVLAIYLK